MAEKTDRRTSAEAHPGPGGGRGSTTRTNGFSASVALEPDKTGALRMSAIHHPNCILRFAVWLSPARWTVGVIRRTNPQLLTATLLATLLAAATDARQLPPEVLADSYLLQAP